MLLLHASAAVRGDDDDGVAEQSGADEAAGQSAGDVDDKQSAGEQGADGAEE